MLPLFYKFNTDSVLKETYNQLATTYNENQSLIATLWAELEKNYSSPKRHYHTLHHLEHLLAQLIPIKETITNWDALLFSLFYHDSIYHPTKKNNEEKSADLAVQRMTQLGVPGHTIALCKSQILATNAHTPSPDPDTNYFTDADLSILGQDTATYLRYTQQVRKEYAIYPDFLYKPGRKKVIQHFLQMERIYKTDHFSQLYESKARENLEMELREKKIKT